MSNYSYKQGANMSANMSANVAANVAPYAAMNSAFGSYGAYGNMPYGMYGQPYAMPYGAMPAAVPSGSVVTPAGGNVVTVPAVEESYVENILRLNRGKLATFYMTYENNREWNAKIFKGIIEAAGRDHIVISDPATGMRFLLLMLNLDYVTFDGPINYEYPFHGEIVTPSTPIASQ